MYPTRRMIFVALAGVPLSLLAAMAAPSFWLVGPAWTLFAIGLFLLDAILAAAPGNLSYVLDIPSALGVARAENATVAVSFVGGAPANLELAIDHNSRLKVIPDRHFCTAK